jgi:hypothetical protein
VHVVGIGKNNPDADVMLEEFLKAVILNFGQKTGIGDAYILRISLTAPDFPEQFEEMLLGPFEQSIQPAKIAFDMDSRKEFIPLVISQGDDHPVRLLITQFRPKHAYLFLYVSTCI